MFFSAFYTTIALALIEFKVCKIYQLYLIIVIYLIFFITNRGQNLDGHETYNTIFFLLCIILGQIIILFIYLIKLAYKKNRGVVITFLLIILVSSIIIYTNNIEDKVKCKNWEYGLNKTILDNNKSEYPCSIIIPNHNCYLNFLGPFFDFSKSISCSNRKGNEKDKLISLSKSVYINEIQKE